MHCYRMVGSFEESEDLVQETLLRGWRGREGFSGEPGALRAWLYRIATNVCLDALRAAPRRVMPQEVGPPTSDPSRDPDPPTELPWLEPYPDRLLEPEAAAVARETIELAYIAAIQHLPAAQRAVLLLRGIVGWSAKETAEQLEMTVAGVNSALQRARATLRERLGNDPESWRQTTEPTPQERELLRLYIEAHDRADRDQLAELLREDARLVMPPIPTWYDGREAILIASQKGFEPEFGELRGVATSANTLPAAAHYLRPPGSEEYGALALDVLRVRDGQIAEITTFVSPQLFADFGLPPSIR